VLKDVGGVTGGVGWGKKLRKGVEQVQAAIELKAMGRPPSGDKLTGRRPGPVWI
jgi:hypothetical protein